MIKLNLSNNHLYSANTYLLFDGYKLYLLFLLHFMEEKMIKYNIKTAENLKDNNETHTSDYWITKELAEKDWEYDEKRVYAIFPYNNTIFFTVSREKTKKTKLKYMFCSKNKDGTFKNLASFKRNKLLNEEDLDSNNKSSIIKKIADAGNNSKIKASEEEYKTFFKDFFTKVIQSDCLQILKDEDYEFQQEEENTEEQENPYILQIEDDIKYRQNPKLNKLEKKQARKVEEYIKENGLINYLSPKLDKLHKGEHKNLYRKLLSAVNIIRGKASFLIETTAEAEEGKSLEDEIVLSTLIPDNYIFKKNNMTFSSFVRYGALNEWFFTRLIIFWGDLGSKKSFEKIEDIFEVIKILITENEYSKDLTDLNIKGINKIQELNLKVESIGGVYSTVKNDFTEGDSQFESRTLSSTPFEVDKKEIMEHISYLKTTKSKQSHDKEEATKELRNFKYYLLSLVNFDKEIVNPYGKVFQRYVSNSKTPIREFEQLLDLFDAYCVLTHHDCITINDTLVASKNQVTTFFSEICLENVLIPYESNFITMLLGKDKKTEMTIIDDSTEENEEKSDPLMSYFKTALEKMNLNENEENVTYYTELETYRQNTFINKLLQLYRLGGSSIDHEENVFFRLSDVSRIYRNYKAYKNIDDLSKLLQTLHSKGYLGKLDFKDPNTKQNIYYITSKCENISEPIELSKDDLEEARKFLSDIGLGDADDV